MPSRVESVGTPDGTLDLHVCDHSRGAGHYPGLASGGVPTPEIRSWSWCRPDMPSLG
jgi:hypothetical protein